MTKRMPIKEFVDTGYLHEVNRLILHPLGLALEVTIDDDGEYSLSGVWDRRDDPEGIYFVKPDPTKAANIERLRGDRVPARFAALGFAVQPAEFVYFISGHLDLTATEFEEHYVPRLREAVREPGAAFVVGDAVGADRFAQLYLGSAGVERVTVYHMFEDPRNNDPEFTTIGGFTSDEERDVAMTAASTHDIAWVRPGRERSGTARNLRRRQC